MDNKLQNCFICDSATLNYFKNIFKLNSKHSQTPIYKFLEKFTSQTFDLNGGTEEEESLVCPDCMHKLNEYDLAMLTVERVQAELTDLLKDTQLKYSQVLLIDDGDDYNEELIQESEITSEYLADSSYDQQEQDIQDVLVDTTEPYSPESERDFDYFVDENIKIENYVSPNESSNEEEQPVINLDAIKVESSICKTPRPETKKRVKNTSKGPHTCEICKKVFMARTEFRIHLSTHTESINFICSTCGLEFKTSSGLNAHMALHNGSSSHCCSICGKTFTQKGALIRHMPLHTGKKQFQCEICGKQFIHNSSFYMHKLAHSGVKDKECTICGMQLRSTSHLSRHMRVHSGEKPFQCPTCGQKFAQRYNMNSHLKVHQGITRTNKVQKCTLCNKSFARKAKLDQHMEDCHPKMPILIPAPRVKNEFQVTELNNLPVLLNVDPINQPQNNENYFITEIEESEHTLLKVEYVN